MTKRLKIASHVHSSWSDDCGWELPRLARVLRRFGFDGALICDHDRTMTEDRRLRLVEECAEVTANGFLVIPGIEYQDPDHVVHIPVYGDRPFLGRSLPVLDILRESQAAGSVPIFAHPLRRNAFREFNEDWIPYLSGIEVWNRKYDGVAPNRWAAMVSQKCQIPAFVGLDFHGPRQLYPLALSLDVDSTTDWEEVLGSLRDARHHATAFGKNADNFANGRLGRNVHRAEELRRSLGPRVRQAEGFVKSVVIPSERR